MPLPKNPGLQVHGKGLIYNVSMKEDETHIVKPRDFAEIIKAPSTDLVADFLEQPFSVIAESITGFLASGPKEWTLSVGRIVQAPFKARLFEQVAQEIEDLRKKGKIREDFADQKYGAKTWVELFTIIDEESPDEDRLDALKAMFFSVNKVGIEDAERILEYQLFQVTQKLNSNELLVLKAAHEAEPIKHVATNVEFSSWASRIAQYCGHSLVALVDLADTNLVENKLFTPRNPSGGHTTTPRLTDLGQRLCENIKWYHIHKNRAAAGA